MGTWEFTYEYDDSGTAYWTWRHLTDDGEHAAESRAKFRTLSACFADARLHGYRGGRGGSTADRGGDAVSKGC